MHAVIGGLPRAAIFLVIANAPFWIVGYFFFVNRPLINIDYALVAALPIGGVLQWCIFAIAATADVATSYAGQFYFAASDVLQNLRFLSMLSWAHVQPLATAALVLGLVVTLAVVNAATCRANRGSIVVVAAIVMSIDWINGTSSVFPRSVATYSHANIAGSRAGVLLVTNESSLERVKLVPTSHSAVGVAEQRIAYAASRGIPILLVIVESLGNPTSTEWYDAIFGGFVDSEDVRDKFDVQISSVPFVGSTTNAELRELCSVRGVSYARMNNIPKGNCLPYRLGRDGYKTFGYHGFSRSMFERDRWWGQIGLEHRYFIEDLPQLTKRCGTVFRGGCDTEIASLLLRDLRPYSFVYFLTLNAHYPLAASDGYAECNVLKFGEAGCAYIGWMRSLFASLKSVMRSARDTPLIIIVGDHAPPRIAPFATQFSLDSIAAVILSPKPKE